MSEKSVLLAPNNSTDINTLFYPLLASTKFDGNRCLLKAGLLLSRTMKSQPNGRLPAYLKDIVAFSKKNNLVFDGELYSHEIPFNELQSFLRNEDKEIPAHVKYHIFDIIPLSTWGISSVSFETRLKALHTLILSEKFPNVEYVPHVEVYSPTEVKLLYEKTLELGFEGLMLRSPNGRYKWGRATSKENIIFKLKPFSTIDAQVIGYEQQQSVRDDIERGVDEMGRTKKTYRAENFVLVENLGKLLVRDEQGREFGCGFGKGWDHDKRRTLWENKSSLIGQWVEIRYLTVGEKDLPRLPQLIRFREAKV